MHNYVTSRMKRDNVSNLFQTPKLREHETTTKTSFSQEGSGVGKKDYKVDKSFFMHRDTFTDYVEDAIRYAGTMRK